MFGVELKVVRAVFLPKPSRAPRRLRLGPHVPYLYSFVGRSGAWTRFSNESHENFSSLPMRPNRESTECGNLYHVAVVLGFLSSPISLAEI